MIWSDIHKTYNNQWLIIEALEAHTTSDTQRHLDNIAVIETCVSGGDAMQKYRNLHKKYPSREFYFVNAGREKLDIRERKWLGIRLSDAVNTEK